jgi:hypothetical protein
VVISRRAVAIASESVVIDQEYPDETLEPDRKSQIPDVLWRSIRAPRGGRRGLATKVRHIKEGIAQGYYQGKYPFVTRDGLEYAKQWKNSGQYLGVARGNCLRNRDIFIRRGGSYLGKACCKSSTNSESIRTGSDLGKASRKGSSNSESIRTTRSSDRLRSKGIIIIISCAPGKTSTI